MRKRSRAPAHAIRRATLSFCESTTHVLLDASRTYGESSATAPSRAGHGGSAEVERRTFQRLYAFAASQLEVHPLKRPWLEGSLTTSLSHGLSVTLVSDVEGVSPDAVAAAVRHEALLLAACFTRGPAGSSTEETFSVDGNVANPLTFLRQELLLQYSALWEQVRELDLQVRLVFKTREVREREEEGVATAAGMSVSCTVLVEDPWAADLVEEVVATHTGHHVREVVAAALGELTTEVRRRRALFTEEVLREAEVRVEEISQAEQRQRSSSMGDWGSVSSRIPSFSCHSCQVGFLVHGETEQRLAVRWQVRKYRPDVETSPAATDIVAEHSRPLVAMTGESEAGCPLVYVQHDTFPITSVESVASLYTAGSALWCGRQRDNGAGCALTYAELTLALGFLKACDRDMLFTMQRHSVGPLRCTPARGELVALNGRQSHNDGLLSEWLWRQSHMLPGKLAAPRLLPPFQPDATTPVTVGVLEDALAYEYGWCHAPRVTLTSKSLLRGSGTHTERNAGEKTLSFRFPSWCAKAPGRFNRYVYAMGSVYASSATALAQLTPLAVPYPEKDAVCAVQKSLSRPDADGEEEAPATGEVTALSPPQDKRVVVHETSAVVVGVLNVEKALRRRGCTHCRFDASRKTLTCLNDAGDTVLEFSRMDSPEGLGKLFRAVGRNRSDASLYMDVTLLPSSSPSTQVRRLLAAMLGGETKRKPKKAPPYVRKLFYPVPLTDQFAFLPFSCPLGQYQLLKQILAYAQHHSRDPSAWPLPNLPPATLFELLPITRQALSSLSDAFVDFSYVIQEATSGNSPSEASFSAAREADSNSENAERQQTFVVSFSCQLPTVPGVMGSRRTFARTSSVSAGAEVLPKFHAALRQFIDTVIAEIFSAGTRAGQHVGDGGHDSAPAATGTDKGMTALVALESALPSLDTLATYAVPSIVTSWDARNASVSVVDSVFRSNAQYHEDTAGNRYELRVALTPRFHTTLASTPRSDVPHEVSWKSRLAHHFVREGMPILAATTAAVERMGSLLESLEAPSVKLTAAETGTSFAGTSRRSAICRFSEVSGDDDETTTPQGTCLAEVRFHAPMGSKQPPGEEGSVVVQGYGANRLEALLAATHKLQHVVDTQRALGHPLPLLQTGFSPNKQGREEGSSGTTASSVAVQQNMSIYRRLAAEIESLLGVAHMHHRWDAASSQLRLLASSVDLPSPMERGQDRIVCAVACDRVDDVPRLLTFLYKGCLAQLKAQGGECRSVCTLNADSVDQQDVLRGVMDTELARSANPTALSAQITKHLPMPTPPHQLAMLSLQKTPEGPQWVAQAHFPADLFLPSSETTDAGSAAESDTLRCVVAAASTKAAALRLFLVTLQLWVVEGNPVQPRVHQVSVLSSKGGTSSTAPRVREPSQPVRIFLPPSTTEKHHAINADAPSRQTPHVKAVRQPRRVVLRPEFQTHTPTSSVTAPVTTPSPAPGDTARSLLQSSKSLAGALAERAAVALMRSTNVHGVVTVKLSRLFGIDVLFVATPTDASRSRNHPTGATPPDPSPQSTGFPQPRRVARRGGKPITASSCTSAPTPRATTVIPDGAPSCLKETAPILTAPWSSSKCAPWPPLQVLACLAEAATRVDSATIDADEGGDRGDALTPTWTRAVLAEHLRGQHIVAETPETLCVVFFEGVLGWPVIYRDHVQSSAASAHPFGGSLQNHSHLRVECVVSRKVAPVAAGPSLHKRKDGRTSPSLRTFSGFEACVRIVQTADSEPPSKAVAASTFAGGFTKTLAVAHAHTVAGAREAAWAECASHLKRSLGLPTADTHVTLPQLYALLTEWVHRE